MEYRDEKRFIVSFAVSCKDLRCSPTEGQCDACLESVVGQCVRKFEGFTSSRITTGNHSRQFGVSFTAVCRKPDCTKDLARGIACCTSHPDKCAMCLRTIVGQNVQILENFHMKEICIV